MVAPYTELLSSQSETSLNTILLNSTYSNNTGTNIKHYVNPHPETSTQYEHVAKLIIHNTCNGLNSRFVFLWYGYSAKDYTVETP